MVFVLSFITLGHFSYLVGVSLSDSVFPRLELADEIATKSIFTLVVFSSIGNFHILFSNVYHYSILNYRTGAPYYYFQMSRAQDIGFGFSCFLLAAN